MHAVQIEVPDPDRASRRRGAHRGRRPPAPDPARARSGRLDHDRGRYARPMRASWPGRIGAWRPSCSAPKVRARTRRRCNASSSSLRAVHERAPGLPIVALGENAALETRHADRRRRAAPPAQHPLPVRGHGAVPGAADHARRRGLPREAAAAVLQGADAPCRALGLLVAHAWARRWRRLHEVTGRLRAARVLRREHGALRPVGLGTRARLAARPHRPGEGGRGLCGAGLRCRPHLLRHQRHFDRQQDRLAFNGRARRPGDRRPQLPQERCCTR